MRRVRDRTLDDVEFDHEDYDRNRWPVRREWAAGARTSPSRALAVERLRLLGVITGEQRTRYHRSWHQEGAAGSAGRTESTSDTLNLWLWPLPRPEQRTAG
jgi:hypothetical protein